MSVPRIGLAVGREEKDGRRFDAVPDEYVAAVLRAGGTPLLLPPMPVAHATDVLEALDGLLLTGGGDIGPACYGALPEPETGSVDDERDASELALVAVATARHVPILGICRGAQLLNVAFGGTLHQHLNGDQPAHQQRTHRHEPVHQVALAEGSLLMSLTGQSRLEVNSIHHQGVDRVAAQLRTVGFAEDGGVEVLENSDRSVLAVQWHPECLPTRRESQLLFSWLIDKAGARRSEKPEGANRSVDPDPPT